MAVSEALRLSAFDSQSAELSSAQWGRSRRSRRRGRSRAEETYPIQSDPVLAVNLIIHATEPTDTWHPAAGRPGEL